MFVLVDELDKEKLKGDVLEHLRKSYPSHYEPQRLIVIDDSNIPFNNHG